MPITDDEPQEEKRVLDKFLAAMESVNSPIARKHRMDTIGRLKKNADETVARVDALCLRIDALCGETEQQCSVCGQSPSAQSGEYPCAKCGVPTLHDTTGSSKQMTPQTELQKAITEREEAVSLWYDAERGKGAFKYQGPATAIQRLVVGDIRTQAEKHVEELHIVWRTGRAN